MARKVTKTGFWRRISNRTRCKDEECGSSGALFLREFDRVQEAPPGSATLMNPFELDRRLCESSPALNLVEDVRIRLVLSGVCDEPLSATLVDTDDMGQYGQPMVKQENNTITAQKWHPYTVGATCIEQSGCDEGTVPRLEEAYLGKPKRRVSSTWSTLRNSWLGGSWRRALNKHAGEEPEENAQLERKDAYACEQPPGEAWL